MQLKKEVLPPHEAPGAPSVPNRPNREVMFATVTVLMIAGAVISELARFFGV